MLDRSAGESVARVLRGAAFLALFNAASAAGAEVEWRPAILGGYAHVFEGHGAFCAGLRFQPASVLFVQAEYLVLPAVDHTDHGPTFQVGLSGRSRDSIRPFVGIGGGPVKGFAGDDGLYYLALGASYPVDRRRGVFVHGELRFGMLGETRYSQFAIGVGLSR
jgi:hypothetical protein